MCNQYNTLQQQLIMKAKDYLLYLQQKKIYIQVILSNNAFYAHRTYLKMYMLSIIRYLFSNRNGNLLSIDLVLLLLALFNISSRINKILCNGN